jgi:hypothetical protein
MPKTLVKSASFPAGPQKLSIVTLFLHYSYNKCIARQSCRLVFTFVQLGIPYIFFL